jgi:hypothetical protein
LLHIYEIKRMGAGKGGRIKKKKDEWKKEDIGKTG